MKNIIQFCASLALIISSVGCTTGSSRFIPEGANMWRTQNIELNDQVTVTKSYTYGHAKGFDGEPAFIPKEDVILKMPAGEWVFENTAFNHIVNAKYLKSHPNFWNEKFTKDSLKNWLPEGQILVPGLGIVQTRKVDDDPYVGNLQGSDGFYSEIKLIIDQYSGKLSEDKIKWYIGIILPSDQDATIASTAVLIPTPDWPEGKPADTLDLAFILSEGRTHTLDLIPFYRNSKQRLYHEYADGKIHLIAKSGKNAHDITNYWIDKNGTLTASAGDIYFDPKPGPKWGEAFSNEWTMYFESAGGGIAGILPNSKGSDSWYKQHKSIADRGRPVYHEGQSENFPDGKLMGFIIENPDSPLNGARYGWVDAALENSTGFIWDEIDLQPQTGPEPRQQIIMAHEPGKGWKAHKFGFPNQIFAFNGATSDTKGKQAALENAKQMAIREWADKDIEKQAALQEEAKKRAGLAAEQESRREKAAEQARLDFVRNLQRQNEKRLTEFNRLMRDNTLQSSGKLKLARLANSMGCAEMNAYIQRFGAGSARDLSNYGSCTAGTYQEAAPRVFVPGKGNETDISGFTKDRRSQEAKDNAYRIELENQIRRSTGGR